MLWDFVSGLRGRATMVIKFVFWTATDEVSLQVEVAEIIIIITSAYYNNYYYEA